MQKELLLTLILAQSMMSNPAMASMMSNPALQSMLSGAGGGLL